MTGSAKRMVIVMAIDMLTTLIVNAIVFSVLFGVMLIIRRLLSGRMSAVMQYALWAVVVIKLVIPFGFESTLSPIGWISGTSAQAEAVQGDNVSTPDASQYTLSQDIGIQPETPAMSDTAGMNTTMDAATANTALETAAVQTAARVQLDQTEWALIIWLCGVLAMGLWLAISLWQLKRRIRRERTETPAYLAAVLNACRKELGIRRRIDILVQTAVAVPAISGTVKPILILPDSLKNADETELRHIFLHELIHYKNGDLIVIQIMNILNCLYWFNPLVWLCIKLMRRDMETICDQRCLRLLDKSTRNGYVSTVLQFAGQPAGGKRLQAALSISSGRCNMEQRIRDMFKRRKTARCTKILAALVAALMLGTGVLTACQPTPEDEIVVNKNDGLLESAIAQTVAPEKAYDAPDSVEESFACKDDRVTINIDADVVVPDVAQFPVIEIMPDEVSLDFIQTAIGVLMEGKTVYEPRTTLTKAEIQDEIIELRQALADPKNSNSDGLNSDDPETVAQTTRLFEERIAIYERLLESAPDTYEPVEATLEFKPAKYYEDPAEYEENVADWTALADDDEAQELLNQYENEQKIVLDANLDGGYYGRITASNYESAGYRWNQFTFVKSKTLNGSLSPEIGLNSTNATDLTDEEAAAIAQDMLGRLGIEGMALSQMYEIKDQQDDVKYGYMLTFQREYGDIPVIDDPGAGNYIPEDERYGPVYEQERIEIRVLDDQVSYFMWMNPAKIKEDENENIEMKTFDEVMEIFRQQMSLEYTLEKLSRYAPENPDYDDFVASLISGQVTISRIELGVVRLAIQDSPGAYRMVPAWKFYGNESVEQDFDGDVLPAEFLMDNQFVYQTINAIDGSIINSASGY
ncbi:MAG: DUF6034 family protein [Eubacteriales bacterium]|nr:DUF6034 family protein [Eubacteriales bacterium]